MDRLHNAPLLSARPWLHVPVKRVSHRVVASMKRLNGLFGSLINNASTPIEFQTQPTNEIAGRYRQDLVDRV